MNNTKRGRKKSNNRSIRIHGEKDFDNLLRKIQVHYLTFIINFANDTLKTGSFHFPLYFLQLNSSIKETVNFNHVSKLKSSSIRDLLILDISDKYKRYNKRQNRELFYKVENKSELLKDLFNINYLELFKYYYNNGDPLEKIVFKEKEIILSNKTKSFYYLAEKYKDLLEGLINVIELVYFN